MNGKADDGMDGILNVCKPVGMTSFDVVALARRWTGTRKIGHTGTLDPDAAGVLTLCVGRATRAVEALTDKDKTYRAELCLGVDTDTQDATGTVLARREPVRDETAIAGALRAMEGPQLQTPPMHSAIRIDGRKLYELAREGKEVERKARAIRIHRCEPVSFRQEEQVVRVLMDVTCSKGTYIRTLCHDVGRQLGCGGHMSFLLRTRTGPFPLSGTHTLEEAAQAAASGRMEELLQPVGAAFSDWPAWACTEGEAARLLHGQTLYDGVSASSRIRFAEMDERERAGQPEWDVLHALYADRFQIVCNGRFLGLGAIVEPDRGMPAGVRLHRQMGV